MSTHLTPEYIALLTLANEYRNAEKRYQRSRSGTDRNAAEKTGKRLDDYLKTANRAENLTPDLYTMPGAVPRYPEPEPGKDSHLI